MRSCIDIHEIEAYLYCPEYLRRQGSEGPPDLLVHYRKSIRKLLVRYYTELLSGHRMRKDELRRSWAFLWDVRPHLVVERTKKAPRSHLDTLLSPEEQYLMRGARVIDLLVCRWVPPQSELLAVDESYTLEGDGVTIEGRFDLVWRHADRVEIVRWDERRPPPHSLVYSILLAALPKTFNLDARFVLTDRVPAALDQRIKTIRSPQAISSEVAQGLRIARAIQLDLWYKDIGSQCRECPYRVPCLGETSSGPKEKDRP